ANGPGAGLIHLEHAEALAAVGDRHAESDAEPLASRHRQARAVAARSKVLDPYRLALAADAAGQSHSRRQSVLAEQDLDVERLVTASVPAGEGAQPVSGRPPPPQRRPLQTKALADRPDAPGRRCPP